jgi:hypothetical protein
MTAPPIERLTPVDLIVIQTGAPTALAPLPETLEGPSGGHCRRPGLWPGDPGGNVRFGVGVVRCS